MAKNPKIKIRLKTDIESLADVISDKVYQMNRIREEELEFQREKFSFEKKTKDRVDISLREYEQMKRDMEWLQSQNNKYAEILAKLKIEEYADAIDPNNVVMVGIDDPRTLTTELHITVKLNKMYINRNKEETGLFH